jgi:hypothetical protein
MALTLHGTVSDNTVALDRKTATPLIINGDMQIAQRGATVTGVTSSGYASLDRYQMDMASQGTFTISQSSDVPTGQGFLNSMKLDCTTADTVLGADNRVAFRQKIEDQNCIAIKKGTANAETLTVAFWVKSNKTGTYVIELYDFANARQVSQSYTIDSANTWEKKVLSYPADTTGTMDNDNTSGIGVQFWITAGTTYTGGTLNTTWNSDTTANRASGLTVNIADSTSNDWYMTGLQLEIGTFDANSIPPFQFEDRATSLARCQRYFYNPLQGTTNAYGVFGQVVCLSSTTARGILYSPSVMRTLPTIVTSGDLELAGDSFTIGVSSIATSARTGTQAMEFTYTVSSGLPSGEGAIVRRRNDASATFQLDAEL